MTDGYENPYFINLIQCFVDNQCLEDYPRDGICKGTNSDAVQSITSLDQVSGDWWVIRGLNCGKGDYPGGYDGKPIDTLTLQIFFKLPFMYVPPIFVASIESIQMNTLIPGYPCQHERFIRTDSDGQWINNVTYCAGQNDVCISDMIVTIANISLPHPGVVRHMYTDAPLSPQVSPTSCVESKYSHSLI